MFASDGAKNKKTNKSFQIRRPLWTVPIPAALIVKLKNAGYEYVEDVLCDANKEGTFKTTDRLFFYFSEERQNLLFPIDVRI